MRNSTIQKKKTELKEDGYLIWKISRITYHFYLGDINYISNRTKFGVEGTDQIDELTTLMFVLYAHGKGCNDILSEEHYRNCDILDEDLDSTGITYLEKERPTFTFESCLSLSEFEDYIRIET